jgi:transcriptional regulator with XRE-family HTH domain
MMPRRPTPRRKAWELLPRRIWMTPQETFVTRLRRHRERNRISLDEIASETRLRKDMLEALERNDLSAWPKGLYARAWIRTYSCAVGLDPIDTVDEFCRLFSNGDRRGHATMQDIAAIVATASEFRDEFAVVERRGTGAAPIQRRPTTWQATVAEAARTAGELMAGLARHVKTRAGAKPT